MPIDAALRERMEAEFESQLDEYMAEWEESLAEHAAGPGDDDPIPFADSYAVQMYQSWEVAFYAG